MVKTIKVVLSGSEGRMGKCLQTLITITDDIEVVYRIDPKCAEDRETTFVNVENFSKRSLASNIDVYVDFTYPATVIDNVARISEMGIDSIIGTTGWYDKIEEMKNVATKYRRRILFSPNFSPGVNAMFYTSRQLARILGRFGYDVAVREIHHSGKVDAPSGTAILLGRILLEQLKGKGILTYERRSKRNDEEIDVSAIRAGQITGQHEVWFTPSDSYSERIVVQHDSFSREAFGKGVLESIRWLYRNKDLPPRLYTFQEDVLNLR
jgi:4-hydroxy-tetrahydrodipicolinate reductase